MVERGKITAPMAQRQATDAGEHTITNPLNDEQELIVQREERAHTKRVIQKCRGYVISSPGVEERLRQMEGRRL